MSLIPQALKYTSSHEWVRPEEDGTVAVGITDHAQHALGDIVFVQLPEAGESYPAKADCAVVESVKSASDLYCPVGGRVIAVNERLASQPELVNQDCYGAGWMFRLTPDNTTEMERLLEADEYAALVSAESN